jgi:hypothetical protein
MLFTYDCMTMQAHFDVLAWRPHDDTSRHFLMTQMMPVDAVHL